MRLFVTGASGFVGKSLLEDLLKEGHEVYGLVREERMAEFPKERKAKPVIGDLFAVKHFKNKLYGMDAVIHLGARIKFVGGLDDFYAINVAATSDLIHSAIEEGVKKFIYVSAAAIVLDGNSLIDITEEYRPGKMIRSNYLKSKLLAEDKILKRRKEIQVIILRPPVIWGPDMRIMEAFKSTIRKMGFPTIGDINHHLATCHVKNLNAAILQSLKSKNGEGIYLISDGEKVQTKKFMSELIEGYGMEMGNMHMPKKTALLMAGFLEFIWKVFHIQHELPITTLIVHLMGTEFTINDTKARKELGYRNVISIEQGLRQLQDV